MDFNKTLAGDQVSRKGLKFRPGDLMKVRQSLCAWPEDPEQVRQPLNTTSDPFEIGELMLVIYDPSGLDAIADHGDHIFVMTRLGPLWIYCNALTKVQ